MTPPPPGCPGSSDDSESTAAFRATLPAGHVIATLMDEHELLLATLDRLAELSRAGVDGAGVEGTRPELAEIVECAGRLIAAEPHHQREEQVLFAELRRLGVTGPPRVMEAEHVDLRTLKQQVRETAESMLATGTDDWPQLRAVTSRLTNMLRDHIAKENEILYPAAVQMIEAPEAWAEMKTRCDAIGYPTLA